MACTTVKKKRHTRYGIERRIRRAMRSLDRCTDDMKVERRSNLKRLFNLKKRLNKRGAGI